MQTDRHSAADDLGAGDIRRFRRRVLDNYRRHGRDLPWRETTDPYRILVSEIMLQQTQVDRVLPKYRAFIKRFPGAAALARAPLQEVLAAWSGLGYNRRAKLLKACAAEIAGPLRGSVPDRPEALARLPGIGPYTARAVCVFAFNQPQIVIETNIRTVYIHHFFQGRGRVNDAELLPFIEKTLYRRDPRLWYNALMDYGAMLKRAFGNPSRQSAHHARQAPFRGSSRELRGLIVKTILMRHACTEEMLVRATGREPEEVQAIIRKLVEEGFLRVEGRRFAIA